MTSLNNHRAAYAVIFAVTLGVLSAAVWRVKPLLSANDRSRWCTVWSLVERGTYQIDEIDAVPGWSTIDKVRQGGHYYSSKPPVLSTIVAGAYWVVRAVTGWSLNSRPEESMRLILFLVNVLPMLAGLLVIMGLVERYAQSDFARLFVVGAFAFSTFLTTFSVTLNNHTVAGLAVLAALYPSCRILADGSLRPVHFACAGFFAVFAAVNELPAAAFAAAVAVLLLWRSPSRAFLWALPAAIVPLAFFFVTTWLATGSWKPFYADYGTEKYKYVVDGVPSYWMHPAGLDANHESPLVYLFHCTLGHHGIVSLSPIFLLALAAWIVPRLSRGWSLRPALWASAAITVVVLAFYLTRTENYNYGGNTSGLRWTFWLIPMWLVSMIPALDALASRGLLRTLALALLAVSTYSAWYPIENPWQHPWLFQVLDRWRWIDYRHPVEPFSRPVVTFFPLLPESDHDWIDLEGLEPNGEPLHLRLNMGGFKVEQGRRLQSLSATWKAGRKRTRTLGFLIDAAAFNAGEPPATSVIAASVAGETKEQADIFLLGLPVVRPYRRENLRYLKTPLRQDAFACRKAAAQVAVDDPKSGRTYVHRIEVWLTAAVPFGVLQFEQTVRDDETDELISARRLTAVATSRQMPERSRDSAASADETEAAALNIPAN
ncbi:MAG TPA: hypothetical protein VG055_17445 [Planctomycetaceae bacterium]|jgi:hypothetical protein|nr:hypothetical protein [Planctomycetaceae bacterium]